MKKAIEGVVSVLKGVSTLDTMLRNTRLILPLLITMTALVGAVRGGHSTLDLVDPSFNPQIQTEALGCKRVNQIIPLPDGKTLVAGEFNSYNGQPADRLVRLNADGALDTTFNSNLPSGRINVDLQADGKILVLIFGQLIRLNADGTLDPTFDNNDDVSNVLIDANGRIIVLNYQGIIRLNSDGSRDPTFQPFPLNNSLDAIATHNNKIIISSNYGELLRLNEDGTIDSSFIQRNIMWMRRMIVQPDGKILILGEVYMQGPYFLRRLNENGSDDAGFPIMTFGTIYTSYYYPRLALSGDGKITLATFTGNPNVYQIRRLLANGTFDNSFTPYSAIRFETLAVKADGSVLIGDRSSGGGCGYNTLSNDFMRLFPNGSPDPTFNTGTGFQTFSPGVVRAINVQPDGKILIGGRFDVVNNVLRYKIARVNADSTLDTSFQINTGGTGNYFSTVSEISNIRAQSDGKIVATGRFDYVVNGATKSNLVRLNSDGSIDPTFILGVWSFDWYEPIRFVTYNDGKLLVGTTRHNLSEPAAPVKLLATGERDTTFNSSVYSQQNAVFILDVAVQPDGKIIIGGRHGTYKFDTPFVYTSFLTRLNADGSLDTTFQSREQLDRIVRAFVLQPNGKIVISESNSPEQFPTQTSVLRLNADGSLDPTFNAGTGANGQVNTMLLLTTGRIFVGGKFTNFNGQPRGNLVQLNPDGSVFTPVYNLNDEVLCLAVDLTGRVFVGGNFTTIIAGNSGAQRSYAAALVDASASSARFDFDGDGRADLGVFSAADGMWSILNSLNYQTVWTNFGLSGDKTAAADFDGDGKTDYAVFRPSTGTWYLLCSRDGFGAVQWGADGDKPVAGDFDGDRKADFAVWRPSSAVWWILKSSNGEASVVRFGLPGDLPLSHADFDGDRKTDIAVWRPSDGNFYWLASGSNNQFNVVHFGQNGDVPAVADYNGDGKTDLVVFRPSEGNWHQYLSAPTGVYSYSVTTFGLSQDEPVPADYDGDGKIDIAVRRGDAWHILNSALGYSVQTFGNANAQAVAAFSIQ